MKNFDYIKIGKNRAKTIFKVFALFILIFTFFSKSFLGWTLPRVTAESVDSGSLLKVMRSEGTVVPKRKFEFYSDISVRVLTLNTEKYAEVNTGDLLMILDKAPIEKALEKEKVELAKLELSLRRIKLTKENVLLELKSESIESFAREMEKSKKDFDNQMVIYESGGISENELFEFEEDYIRSKENY